MAAFKKVSPFSQPLPDDRISLCVYADNTGLRMWNKNSDPMPIKTRNMAGLQKWEETDDYIIYLDKDAVMTTVESYVTGTYDLFKERKADIDRSMELLRANDIEWTAEDDSKLILDINKAQLERIANTPTTMEEDAVPQTLTTRAVPTTYEACFRVDKSSGEIYIGEGYENLGSESKGSFGCSVSKIELGSFNVVINSSNNGFKTINASSLIIGETYTVSWIADGDFMHTKMLKSIFEIEKINTNKESFLTGTVIGNQESYNDAIYFYGSNIGVGSYTLKKVQITKTSTPKPFVKSVMPSGKLAFVTNATSKTHSFVMKQFESIRYFHCSSNYDWANETAQSDKTVSNNETPKDVLISKLYKMAINNSGKNLLVEIRSEGVTRGAFTLSWRRQELDKKDGTNSFKQLLIYKGNLTEAELKAENEKNIRLK